MQLGLTIPLQRFLKVHQPPYGTLCDLFYCWDLHRIILQSKETLVAVNANNRFAIVMCGMDFSAWKDYNALFMDGLRQGMLLEGFKQTEIEEYFKKADDIEITKTHGRRSVSGLNQMDNYLWSIPVKVKADELFQAVHCHEVNRERCKMAGYEGDNIPVECFERDMKRVGIF